MDKGQVLEISLELARPFIEKWHYSHRVPTGANTFFGWFIQDGGLIPETLFGETLYAVSDYGIGVNTYQAQSLAELTGWNITDNNLIELKRQCRIEPKLDKYPLTYFMSRCHRKLATMGYKYIVTFSDPHYGHNGGVYKAANFMYLGQTNEEWHLADSDGNVRHRKYAGRYAERNGITIEAARVALRVTRVKTEPKDRWILKI